MQPLMEIWGSLDHYLQILLCIIHSQFHYIIMIYSGFKEVPQFIILIFLKYIFSVKYILSNTHLLYNL